MADHSVVHSTFTIERSYKAPPARVFAAFANKETKRRWFVEGEGWEVEAFELDFRVGGIEHARFRFKGTTEMANDTVYQDIVPDRRIVLAYTMTMAGKRISASLATVEITPAGSGSKLTFTEQGAFFDGADGAKMREEGWNQLLGALEAELQRAQ